jgi:hypothetical protein
MRLRVAHRRPGCLLAQANTPAAVAQQITDQTATISVNDFIFIDEKPAACYACRAPSTIVRHAGM